MLFNLRKKKSEPTKSQIDYANELYRIFHGRQLEPHEINRETVEKIIAEYSGKLLNTLNKN